MGNKIKRCVIVSGAPEADLSFIENNIIENDYVICADSGYKKCMQIGIVPDLIIGDFDSSLKPDLPCEIITLNREKAYTDTFHCVIEAVERGYKNIIIFGAIGDRFDHTYANILCLNYCLKNSVQCCIANRKNRISLIKNEKRINRDYKNFSLFAFLEPCRQVRINGAYYTAGFYSQDAIDFETDSQMGVSNFVTDEYATVTVECGTLLLIESND